jgi:hypothetical protein
MAKAPGTNSEAVSNGVVNIITHGIIFFSIGKRHNECSALLEIAPGKSHQLNFRIALNHIRVSGEPVCGKDYTKPPPFIGQN